MGSIITLEQQRAEQCMVEVQHILTKNRCDIIPVVTIRGDGIVQGGFQIVPNVVDKKIEGGD